VWFKPKVSPSPSTVRLAKLVSAFIFVGVVFRFAGAFPSTKGLLMNPFTLAGAASFFIRDLFNEPLCIFFVATFFIGGLFNEPILFFGVAIFSSDVF
jgi:hypothetical protein